MHGYVYLFKITFSRYFFDTYRSHLGCVYVSDTGYAPTWRIGVLQRPGSRGATE
jgi:hypothetical protein